jgi:acyl carrier protein
MTKEQFYTLLDELLEQDPGTIKGEELLTSLQRWDSLAVIGFIAMLDEHFSISVPAARIIACKSVPDLVALVADKLT